MIKMEWKEHYRKLCNEQGSKGEEGTEEERNEGTDDNEDNTRRVKVLKHATGKVVD